MAYRSWCFTINNYDEEDKRRLDKIDCRYIIAGEEISRNGTPHLQGYIYYKRSGKRFGGVKKDLGHRAHVEPAKGSAAQNKNYCSKDGSPFIEKGEMPTQGQRTDIIQMIDKRMNGVSHSDIKAEYGASWAVNKRKVDECVSVLRSEENIKKLKVDMRKEALRPWQDDLRRTLEGEPDKRKVLWYWEEKGNTGKTFMSQYIIAVMNGFRTDSGKSTDVAHAYDGERIVVFDFSRSLEERVNYDLIEKMKNGMLFSGKYESKQKIFPVPHVLIFANFEPDKTKLSADRWRIVEITEDMCM